MNSSSPRRRISRLLLTTLALASLLLGGCMSYRSDSGYYPRYRSYGYGYHGYPRYGYPGGFYSGPYGYGGFGYGFGRYHGFGGGHHGGRH